MTTGILLVNLGTPDSPDPRDVKRYLHEFLTDGRVIDEPWLKRQLLVRGIIVPRRYKESATSYQEIWMEEGSPLLVYGKRVCRLLEERLGEAYKVELAMRYQNPSIKKGVDQLVEQNVDRIIVFPLFPQYASATTGSVHQKVMEVMKEYPIIPEVTFVEEFSAHPAFLEAFAAIGSEYDWKDYDHVIFSFHGLPERQLVKADRRKRCLKTADCCKFNRRCYRSQCYATAEGIADRLGIGNYTVCFQSRLGNSPWLQPYASDVIEGLAAKGCKRILAFCPSFVCDCLETIFEFGVEYNELFQEKGGEKLDFVEGLNDDPRWVDALAAMILQYNPQEAIINR